MSYTKEISFRDYTINFEYRYNDYPQCLGLNSWTAYIGDNEVSIPCSVESEFIENKLIDWLDWEFARHGGEYRLEYLNSVKEKRVIGD